MYRFQIIAATQPGESIGIVGSDPALGDWDITRYVPLRTSADRQPLWWVEVELPEPPVTGDWPILTYKYVRVRPDGIADWEAFGLDRWVPLEPGHRDRCLVVDDGAIGYLQPYPYGYFEPALPLAPAAQSGLKVVIIGSSVAAGHRAWLQQGWAAQLAQTLQAQYGHTIVNVSAPGTDVASTIARFAAVVTPQHPDLVIIALSLGNEGLAHCPPHARRAVQRRFESGLQELVKMTRALGARPLLGGVYPNGHYTPEHAWLLRDTHQRMLTWGVPVLDWLAVLDDGQGRWQPGISFDPAHPNTAGHQRMYAAIAPHLAHLFEVDPAVRAVEKQHLPQAPATSVYADAHGFQITAWVEEHRLRLDNPTPHAYTLAAYWEEVQMALKQHAGLIPGLYVTATPTAAVAPSFAVQTDGAIETTIQIPPETTVEYQSAFDLFAPSNADLLFYDGHLGILKEGEQQLRILNEADQEYNLQPMWPEVRQALQAMPTGVYTDPLNPTAPFRTLMIGPDGLESRVKAPPRSALVLRYHCPLSAISRVAILPLGDRCAVRMLLYKLEYDGPAFPFDLTRTTQISDVADMIAQRFTDMWNPDFLHYNAAEGRIYHRKWSGLSFAHEVEPSDHPEWDMTPIWRRMQRRYSARAARFSYALEHCDKVLFVRTGGCDRAGVADLLTKLADQCQGKPFRLLLLSPQDSAEFADLPEVQHENVDFNPDRMYADPDYWRHCTEVMRGILDSLGVSSQNLYWCPPTPPAASAATQER